MTIAAASKNEELCPVARHIARAAARLFAERGYDATSVREIVEAAGVAKPTLYYYFGSKEGLAQALITAPLSTLGSTLEQIVSQVEDPVNCLEQVIEAQYSFCRDDPDRGRFIYALLFGPLGSEMAGELELPKECLAELDGRSRAPARGSADRSGDRVDACATACRGLIVISTLDYLYHEKTLGCDLAREHVHDLLRGFGGSDTLKNWNHNHEFAK